MATAPAPPLLEMRGISKQYPGVKALEGVNLADEGARGRGEGRRR
jgi:ABC-type sugar transport system ATPase subunit